MSVVRLSDVKVGDVVTYHTTWWKPTDGKRRSIAIGKVTAIDPERGGKTGLVTIVRIVDGRRASCSIPPARIVGFHVSGTPF